MVMSRGKIDTGSEGLCCPALMVNLRVDRSIFYMAFCLICEPPPPNEALVTDSEIEVIIGPDRTTGVILTLKTPQILWPDWGNTTRADMAGLGSIGLNGERTIFLPLLDVNGTVVWYYQ